MAAAVFRSRSSCGCSFRSRGDAVLVNCCSRYYHLPLLTAICSTSEWTGIAQSALKWAAEDALAYVLTRPLLARTCHARLPQQILWGVWRQSHAVALPLVIRCMNICNVLTKLDGGGGCCRACCVGSTVQWRCFWTGDPHCIPLGVAPCLPCAEVATDAVAVLPLCITLFAQTYAPAQLPSSARASADALYVVVAASCVVVARVTVPVGAVWLLRRVCASLYIIRCLCRGAGHGCGGALV